MSNFTKRQLFLIVSSLCLSTTVNFCFAETASPPVTHHQPGLLQSWQNSFNSFAISCFRPLIALNVGKATAEVGQTQTLSTSGILTHYRYARNGSFANKYLIGGFLGGELPIMQKLNLQLGVGYYQPSSFGTGDSALSQGIGPVSTQYTYNYQVLSRQVLAEAKLLWLLKENVYTYFGVGLGAAFNNAYGYTTNVPSLVLTPQLTSNSTTSFTYSLSIGLDIDLQRNWRVGGCYRFTDLGHSALGNGKVGAVPFPTSLSQSHLYAEEVMAHLTYLFF